MSTLATVADYVRNARVLLQDTVADYRYSDTELVEGLNLGLLEMRRVRADLLRSYFKTDVPSFSASAMATSVPVDQQYRVALLYYICGQAQLRDDEDTQGARATAFLNKFVAQLLTVQS